jgi:hypothetical protein
MSQSPAGGFASIASVTGVIAPVWAQAGKQAAALNAKINCRKRIVISPTNCVDI